MNTRLVGIALAVLLPAAASADTTVRSHEGGVRDGKPWGESYTEYHSPAGLHVDVTADGAAAPYMSLIFLRNPDRLFIVHGTSVTSLDAASLRALEKKAGLAAAPSHPRVVALGTHHSVNGFACEGYQLRRKGLATRYLCLAAPGTLGLSPEFVADSKDMRIMLSRYMAVVQRSMGNPVSAFNPYALAQGYPVRLWESSKGEITWESLLLSVSSGPTPPGLFSVPEPSN